MATKIEVEFYSEIEEYNLPAILLPLSVGPAQLSAYVSRTSEKDATLLFLINNIVLETSLDEFAKTNGNSTVCTVNPGITVTY
jgi:hypothetical protein